MNVLRISGGMLIAALVAACGGGDPGGTGGATNTSSSTGVGGGIGEACDTCVEVNVSFDTDGTPCHDAAQACLKNKACGTWMDCTNTCFEQHRDADCFSACDAVSSSAKSLYDPLYACVCAACASECKPICM